jgi:hypothetical protein
MLFIFSPSITLKRKVGYIGLMLVTVAIVLLSMVDFNKQDQVDLLAWISVVAIAGLSLLLLVLLHGNTRNMYIKHGKLFFYILISQIPILSSVLIYLLCVLSSFEEFGEIFILKNTVLILLFNIPIILIASHLMTQQIDRISLD